MDEIITCMDDSSHESAFDCLSDEDWKLLDQHKVEISFKKGEVLAKQGSFASNVFYLKEGLVKVYLEGAQKDLILKIIQKDHFLSLSSIYNGNNSFLYSCAALTDCNATLYDINVIKNILRTNARFAYRVISILNENKAHTYKRVFCLTQKQAHGRVADLLLCLSSRVFKEDSFYLPFPRIDFAGLAGLSVESVVRILKEFKDDGLISFQGKSFEILNKESLSRVCKMG